MMKKELSRAAASGDPFYVFKDDLETKVAAVNQKHAKWRVVRQNVNDVSSTEELVNLTQQIEGAVVTAEKAVKFLEETIVMVETNRAKFEHIDAAEIASRKAFVAATKKELEGVSADVCTDAVMDQSCKEERESIAPLESSTSSSPHLTDKERNERLLEQERLQRQQIMQQQDTNLAGLQTDITRLHGVTVEISNEVKQQNKMLDDMTDDVDEAQERMNFVMGRLSNLLKTKDKCQLGLILFLVAVLVAMVFLVVYT
uniref:t-SNARE coiled-coil homology domain-containing protein n=1 Tax=Peronospora matthiolae TaxID=2874970 RepID=A0AAV1THR2_9STRA